MLTFGDQVLRNLLAALRMPEKTNGNANAFPGEHAVIVLVRKVPYFREHCWGELRTAEYLDRGFTSDDTEFLGVGLSEDLVDERDFRRCGGELGHGQ